MNRNYSIHLFVFLFLTCFILRNTSLQAQNFGQLSQADGLSQSYIYAILQDYTGFMWFGTGDGLNRYDGYNFKVYYHDPNDPSSISNNQISALALAPDSCIWIGTDKGLNRYDPATDKFTRYDIHAPTSAIALNHCLLVDQDGLIWFSNYQDLNLICFNPKTFKTEFFSIDYDPCSDHAEKLKNSRIQKLFATSIFQSTEGSLWIGTSHGKLLQFDKVRRKFISQIHVVESDLIGSIAEPDGHHLYVASGSRGCFLIDLKKKSSTPVFDLHDPVMEPLLSQLYLAFLDDQHHLILGTKSQGLFNFDPDKKVVFQELFCSASDSRIIQKGVYSLYSDKSGILWCGTNGYGIYYLSPYLDRFKTINQTLHFEKDIYRSKDIDVHVYFNQAVNTTSFSFQSVRGIYATDDIVLVGGYNGLDIIDRLNGHITNILGNIVPYVIKPDADHPEKFVWIGLESSGNSLFRMNLKTNQLVKQPLESDFIFSIFPDKNHTLWIGTGSQLIKYDTRTGNTDRYAHDPSDSKSLQAGAVKTIIRDLHGILWIGTAHGGISWFNENNKMFIRFQYQSDTSNSLNNNMILSLFADSSNRLWIATGGGGVNILDSDRKNFTHLTKKNGLPNDFIYAILEDDQKMLWFSTNHGIFKLNPKTFSVKSFSVSDGLQGNEFNTGAYFKDDHGELFFGGINGLSSFRPADVMDNPFKPVIILTSVKVANELITYHIPYHELKELTFPYNNKIITLGFSALSYLQSTQNEYAYRIAGIGNEWINLGTKREITFHALIPGRYRLEVNAANNDGVWSDSSLVLTIIITPPFWKTWWFYILCFLFIVGVILVYIRYRTFSINRFNRFLTLQIEEHTQEIVRQKKEIEAQKVNLEERIAERTGQLESINKELEFQNKEIEQFTYIASHDLQEPLRTLTNYSQLIQEEYAEKLDIDGKKYIEFIFSSAMRMRDLVKGLLDYSLLGKERVIKEVDCKQIIIEVLSDMNGLILETNARLMVMELPRLNGYKTELRLLFQNLISNALKFRKQNVSPEITISVCNKEKVWIFAIQDNGIGIEEKDKEKIFIIFKRMHNRNKFEGTGIGLAHCKKIVEMHGGRIWVESTPGEGSTFYFSIPI